MTARLSNIFLTMYVFVRIVGFDICTARYSSFIDINHMLVEIKIYSVVAFFALLEVPLIRYLPWFETEFAKNSQGMPDFHLFCLCLFGKLAQSIVTVVCQLIFLYDIYRTSEVIISNNALAFLGINLSTTLITVIVNLIQAFFSTRLLQRLDADPTPRESSLFGVGLADLEMSPTATCTTAVEECPRLPLGNNPMHFDESYDTGTQQQQGRRAQVKEAENTCTGGKKQEEEGIATNVNYSKSVIGEFELKLKQVITDAKVQKEEIRLQKKKLEEENRRYKEEFRRMTDRQLAQEAEIESMKQLLQYSSSKAPSSSRFSFAFNQKQKGEQRGVDNVIDSSVKDSDL